MVIRSYIDVLPILYNICYIYSVTVFFQAKQPTYCLLQHRISVTKTTLIIANILASYKMECLLMIGYYALIVLKCIRYPFLSQSVLKKFNTQFIYPFHSHKPVINARQENQSSYC